MASIATVTLLGLPGCGHTEPAARAATTASLPSDTWRTLRAQHKITFEYERDGEKKSRNVRGVLFAVKPDRFRARVFGPADLTLLDVAGAGGQCTLLYAVRRPKHDLIDKLCQGLRAAYRIEPPPTSPPAVHYADWRTVGGKNLPFHIVIEGQGFKITLIAEEQAADVAIPTSLFKY